jgi:hypothetical protein
MVTYEYRGVFPAPRDRVWALLNAHMDDGVIGRIHHLIKSQHTVSRSNGGSIVDREIDARGKVMRSRWKLEYRPPDFSRWEVVDSVGPWAPGTYVENRYSDDPAGTMIETKGDLKISVLPFFLPQKSMVRRVLDTVDSEDQAYLRTMP